MKRVVFVSRSKLSQNLLGLIMQSLPKKIEYTPLNTLEELEEALFSKAIHLILIDHNTIHPESSWAGLETKPLKTARKVFIHTRKTKLPHDLEEVGFHQAVTKPFLTEELVELIENHLGGKK